MGRLKHMAARIGSLPPRVKLQPKLAERFYQSKEWISYRKRHAAWTRQREGGLWCCKCFSNKRLILDHAVERKDGGADFPPFEQAHWYCAGCHNRKTAEARAKRASGKG
ncbi:hypothetical protein ACRAQ6_14005 [Erythrobacter sp. HA6-11]